MKRLVVMVKVVRDEKTCFSHLHCGNGNPVHITG